MAYPIKDHNVYNMVLLHPDVNNTSESWTSKGSKKQMLDFYGEWCPSANLSCHYSCNYILIISLSYQPFKSFSALSMRIQSWNGK